MLPWKGDWVNRNLLPERAGTRKPRQGRPWRGFDDFTAGSLAVLSAGGIPALPSGPCRDSSPLSIQNRLLVQPILGRQRSVGKREGVIDRDLLLEQVDR